MKMGKDLPQSESIEQKAEALRSLISGRLPSSASRLLSLARGLPSDKDFHFYNNFDEFKLPAREIAAKAESSLGDIASSSSLWGSRKPPPVPGDLDDAYDWLVNVNDDLLEKFGVSMDDFRSSREKQEQAGVVVADPEDGFQLVYGKKKKRETLQKSDRDVRASDSLGIKMVSRDKKTTARTKVPFHLPSIPRPQEEFNILVNNKNLPFEHVWLEKSEDGRFVHPLEKLSVIDFTDKNIKEDEIIKPFPLASTQFKLIEGVKELKKLAAKLHEVNEFAVDLEHNQYRSFLGLTCLMQISTRTEDFIIDTLKLRVQIGPYLREAFKDPLKRKIMHGADRDILWLQRDFGIYVCNLFDTGQASRLLQLERNSLQYLLRHFCDIEANKEYQNADWRLRPLPDEMIKYAREDTHYLLHIYDLMRCKLLSLSSDDNDLLLEVYKRSSEVCMQLYEKEILTDISYRYIYGLSEADFDSKQLAIVAGLCQWRDTVAREEDESTGYILPNRALLEIARQMPHSSGKLRRLVKSKHQYVERHLNTVLKIIQNAIADSSAFESIAEELRQARTEASATQISEAENNSESVTHTENAVECSFTKTDINNDSYISTNTNQSIDQIASVCSSHEKQMQMSLLELTTSNCDATRTVKKEIIDNGAVASQLTEKVTPAASIQAIRKPTCGFGALFRKTSAGNGAKQENESKVAQIKASVILPFYPFSSDEKLSEPNPAEHVAPTQTTQSPDQPSKTTIMEDVIPLGNGTNSSDFPAEGQKDVDVPNGDGEDLKSEADTRGRFMSLSDLSSGFQQCFQSINERRNSEVKQMPLQEPQYILQLTPFDYAAARKAEKLGESDGETGGDGDVTMADGGLLASIDVPKNSLSGRRNGEQRERGQQPRRRQAFPSTGNRSTTYRC